jgi:hypothetical protein
VYFSSAPLHKILYEIPATGGAYPTELKDFCQGWGAARMV